MVSHWQRVVAFLTWCMVIGLALILFTHKLFKFADFPGATGYITLFLFGAVFLNLCFIINRRFTLKSENTRLVNYLFSVVILTPTLFWIFTKNEKLGDTRLAFILIIVFAALVGTYFGRWRGIARRERYWNNQEYYKEEELPDNLKRPHDHLSKN